MLVDDDAGLKHTNSCDSTVGAVRNEIKPEKIDRLILTLLFYYDVTILCFELRIYGIWEARFSNASNEMSSLGSHFSTCCPVLVWQTSKRYRKAFIAHEHVLPCSSHKSRRLIQRAAFEFLFPCRQCQGLTSSITLLLVCQTFPSRETAFFHSGCWRKRA